MLVREIIQMSKEKPIRQIAKDHLEIGEKKLTDTLKKIGATNQRGKRGWDFRGNSDLLELSIYDLVEDGRKASAETKEQTNKVTDPQTNKVTGETLNFNTGEIIHKNTGETLYKVTESQANKPTDPQPHRIIRRRTSYDIDERIIKKIKYLAIEKDQRISQIVEDILSLYFNEK